MKNTLLLLLSFLLFAFATKALVGATEESFDPVLDTDGEELKVGINYYILPLFRGRGGGVTLALHRNGTCPLDVVQDSLEVSPGLPLTFSPANVGTKGVIRVSTDLNIKFSPVFTPYCRQSTVWKLDHFDDLTGLYFVITGGVEGNPGCETVSNWFKIEKSTTFPSIENVYKLRFCPLLCETFKVVCKDVGIDFIDRKWRLAVGDDTISFEIMFRKVELTHEVYASI